MSENVSTKSIKHSIIERTNSTMVATVAIAVFTVIFCAFALKSLIGQSLYQQRVISLKQDALNTLIDNKDAAVELKETYTAFATSPINALGADAASDGPLGGDNPKIVLDALPSEYDYPALSSSIEKLLVDGGYLIDTIGGKEDETIGTNQSLDTATETDTAAISSIVEPVEVPFPISISATPESTQQFLRTLERSIRPIRIDSIEIASDGKALSTTIQMSTYYLPATGLKVIEEIVE